MHRKSKQEKYADNDGSSQIGDESVGPTASIPMLRLRANLLARLRNWFHEADYWEVETPILSHDIVIDAHLEPFSLLADSGEEVFLQTSPEFSMKRLLAAGADAIYQVARAFRRGEVGQRHNPEFTMVEWYKVGDSHHEQMDFTESLVQAIASGVAGVGAKRNPGEVASCSSGFELDRRTPFSRITYDEAFERAIGCRVLNKSASELAELSRKLELTTPEGLGDDRDEWLNILLAELVEPTLGIERPEFLFDYPASQAALAKTRDEDGVAERFELYINGIEICNGYHELTDANILRRRNIEQSQLRAKHGGRPLPQDSRLLAAMEAGLPDCSGVALGFDRLLMVLTRATSLADVMAFPFDRA